MVFQYQIAAAGTITDADTPSTGWTNVTALDFASPTFTNTGAGVLLDGNAAANRTAKSSAISVNLPVGQEIWIRWTDINDAGNDHGLSIDDIAVTPAVGDRAAQPDDQRRLAERRQRRHHQLQLHGQPVGPRPGGPASPSTSPPPTAPPPSPTTTTSPKLDRRRDRHRQHLLHLHRPGQRRRHQRSPTRPSSSTSPRSSIGRHRRRHPGPGHHRQRRPDPHLHPRRPGQRLRHPDPRLDGDGRRRGDRRLPGRERAVRLLPPRGGRRPRRRPGHLRRHLRLLLRLPDRGRRRPAGAGHRHGFGVLQQHRDHRLDRGRGGGHQRRQQPGPGDPEDDRPAGGRRDRQLLRAASRT